MLARSTTLVHPAGTTITTPLLIPSFSSRGFGSGPRGANEVDKLVDVSKEQLTDSVLISAYDLYHKHLKKPRRAIANITFVDSGGYETSDYQDLSAFFTQETRSHAWSAKKLAQIYDGWPDYVPAVFVSYDQRGAVARQARRALALLRGYPQHLHAFLVKPRTQSDRFVSVDDVVSNLEIIDRKSVV